MSTPVIEDVLTRALRERGQRVTPQRLAIARTVRELDRHVTAETVFARATEQVPGISLPTVYATLELLESLGLVRRVATETATAVFDPRTDAHHHLVCRACGKVVDVDASVDQRAVLAAAHARGFTVDDAQLVIRGVCERCAQRGERAESPSARA